MKHYIAKVYYLI